MKATVKDVIAIGFSAVHFGAADNFALENDSGYVYRILTDVSREVRGHVGGSRYDAATADGTEAQQLDFARIKSAEIDLCAADLFSRRVVQVDNSTHRSLETVDRLMSELRRNAQKHEDRAWRTIALITGSTQNGSFSTGMVETGAFPAAV